MIHVEPLAFAGGFLLAAFMGKMLANNQLNGHGQ
jgi:hypothetical protein